MEIVGDTFAETYKQSLILLSKDPDFISSPRGFKIKEILNLKMEILNPLSNCFKNSIRESQLSYISKELQWYLSGDLGVNFIGQYAKLWKQLVNMNDEVHSNYGNLLWYRKTKFNDTQWNWAVKSLLKDPDSRQAIIRFNNDEHQYLENKDFVCTMYGIFHIRNDELFFTISMRSSDCIYGWPTDFTIFSVIHQQMLRNLQVKYPNLRIGKFTYIGNSYHLYEKHFDIVDKMIKSSFISSELPELDIDLVDINGKITNDAIEFINGKNPSKSKFIDYMLSL